MLCKIYNDGSHYIATPKLRGVSTRFVKKKVKTILDKDFDRYFLEAITEFRSYKKQLAYIKEKILSEYGYPGDELIGALVPMIEEKYKAKMKNIQLRKKRFRRKAFLNEWNYFVTFTYDMKLGKLLDIHFDDIQNKCFEKFLQHLFRRVICHLEGASFIDGLLEFLVH